MHLIYTYDKVNLKSRYTELRSTVLSESNVALKLSNFMTLIPEGALVADCEKWHYIPSTNVDHFAQIVDWYRLRCQYMDAEVAAL